MWLWLTRRVKSSPLMTCRPFTANASQGVSLTSLTWTLRDLSAFRASLFSSTMSRSDSLYLLMEPPNQLARRARSQQTSLNQSSRIQMQRQAKWLQSAQIREQSSNSLISLLRQVRLTLLKAKEKQVTLPLLEAQATNRVQLQLSHRVLQTKMAKSIWSWMWLPVSSRARQVCGESQPKLRMAKSVTLS